MQFKIVQIFSNKKDAFVLERAKKLEVPATTFSKQDFNEPSFLDKLQHIDFIILAGFLLLVPEYLIEAFPEKIINIHPALTS